MYVGGCSLIITILALSFTLLFAETPSSVTRKKRQIFPLLGFLQGYKMGQNFALQLPPFVLSPVVVIPSLNQRQNVNLNETGENDSLQIISPEKLVQKVNCNSSGLIENNDIKETENAKVKQEKNELMGDEEDNLEEDMFKQNIIVTNNSLSDITENKENATEITSTEVTETTITEIGNITYTTTPYRPYPTAIYKFDNISTLTITEAPINSDLMLPSTENHWQNFTTQDMSVMSGEKGESRTGTQHIYTKYQNPIPYYNYQNRDKIKYREWNYEHPVYQAPNRDRWNTYYPSGNNQITSEFRPLAGLYYDGFLHRPPIKKTGFVPNNNNYYY